MKNINVKISLWAYILSSPIGLGATTSYTAPQDIQLSVLKSKPKSVSKKRKIKSTIEPKTINDRLYAAMKKKKRCDSEEIRGVFRFWQSFSYIKPQTVYPYQEGMRQCEYCLRDIAYRCCYRSWPTWNLKPRDSRRLKISKIRRQLIREHFYPVITKKASLALVIFTYGVFNITRDTENKVDQILGGDFRFCVNPKLDSMILELPNFEEIREEHEISDLFAQARSKIDIDYTLYPQAPNVTFLYDLLEKVKLHIKEVNRTHYIGFEKEEDGGYAPYWNQPITEDFRTSVSRNSSSSTSTNLTNTEQRSIRKSVTKTSYFNEQRICFSRKKFGWFHRLALKNDFCTTYRYPVIDETLNKEINIKNITNITRVNNNYYNTLISSRLESVGLSAPELIDPETTINQLNYLADQFSQEAAKKFKEILIQILKRGKLGSDLFPFWKIIVLWFCSKYQASKMPLMLGLHASIGNITKCNWILLIVGGIYIVELLPFGWPDIWLVIGNPKILIDLMLSFNIYLCHFQSKKEIVLLYDLGEKISLQQTIRELIEKSDAFIENEKAIEDTYKNFTLLTYKNIYEPLHERKNYYKGLLNGSIFYPNVGSFFSEKSICDASLFPGGTFSPTAAPTLFPTAAFLQNQTNATFSLEDSQGGTTPLRECATIFDYDYAQIIQNDITENYRVDPQEGLVGLLLWPFAPIITTAWIIGLWDILCPMASVGGSIIGSKNLILEKEDELIDLGWELQKAEQDSLKKGPKNIFKSCSKLCTQGYLKHHKIAKHKRLTSIFYFSLITFFFILTAANRVL